MVNRSMKKIIYQKAHFYFVCLLFLLVGYTSLLAGSSVMALVKPTKIVEDKPILLPGKLSQPNPIPPAGCTGNDPGGNPAANGLYAEYYTGTYQDDPNFFVNNTPALVRFPDAPLDYVDDFLSNSVPIAGPNPQSFSARYRGSIYIATAGLYTFYLSSDDGSYLWLDNAALGVPADNSKASINHGGSYDPSTKQVSIYLTAGFHNLLVHYEQGAGPSAIKLEYEGSGIARQVIPASVLCSSVQPMLAGLPVSITYSPAFGNKTTAQTFASPVPVVNNGGSPITQYIITSATAVPLPVGITVGTNGVISADASVPSGSYKINLALGNANGISNFAGVYDLVVSAAPPPGCTGTDPGGNQAMAGLYAEYYAGYFDDDPNFFVNNTPTLVRFPDAPLDYSNDFLSNSAPIAGTNPQYFSARYRGSIYVATAGVYTFYLTSDDASYLWLDNAAVNSPTLANVTINNGGLHGNQTVEASISLAVGRHDILIY
jgi:hypothetical protein